MALDEKIIAALKVAHGQTLHLHTFEIEGSEYLFVTRPATTGEWKRAKEATKDPAKSVTAVENFARATTVYVSGAASIDKKDVAEAFNAILEKFPALGDNVGAKVVDLAAATAACTTSNL